MKDTINDAKKNIKLPTEIEKNNEKKSDVNNENTIKKSDKKLN